MANLLRFVVELAQDRTVRDVFRDDPVAVMRRFGDDVTAEDIGAVAELARLQLPPDLAERLAPEVVSPVGSRPSPFDAAVQAVQRLCDALDGSARVVAFPDRTRDPSTERGNWAAPASPREPGDVLPDRPPGTGVMPHLWALDGADAPDDDGDDAGDDDGTDREAPASRLAPVPDPDRYEYEVLELVSLPHGLPDAGIEPGAVATIVSVHRHPELRYEIEVSYDDGSRRFLGEVPADAVGPHSD